MDSPPSDLVVDEPTPAKKMAILKQAIKELKKRDSTQAVVATLHAMYDLDDVIPEILYDSLAETLCSPRNVARMVALLTSDVGETSDLVRILDYQQDARGNYEYRHVISLYMCYGPGRIREMIVTDDKLLKPLARFLSSKTPKSVVALELVARVIASLLHQHPDIVLHQLLLNRNFVPVMVTHIGCSAIASLIPRMVCERGFFDDEQLRFGRISIHALNMLARDDTQMLIAQQIVNAANTGVKVLPTSLTIENGLWAMRQLSIRAMMVFASLAENLDELEMKVKMKTVVKSFDLDRHAAEVAKLVRKHQIYARLARVAKNDPMVAVMDTSSIVLDLFQNGKPTELLFHTALTEKGLWMLPELLLNINRLLRVYTEGFLSHNLSIAKCIAQEDTSELQKVICKHLPKMVQIFIDGGRTAPRHGHPGSRGGGNGTMATAEGGGEKKRLFNLGSKKNIALSSSGVNLQASPSSSKIPHAPSSPNIQASPSTTQIANLPSSSSHDGGGNINTSNTNESGLPPLPTIDSAENLVAAVSSISLAAQVGSESSQKTMSVVDNSALKLEKVTSAGTLSSVHASAENIPALAKSSNPTNLGPISCDLSVRMLELFVRLVSIANPTTRTILSNLGVMNVILDELFNTNALDSVVSLILSVMDISFIVDPMRSAMSWFALGTPSLFQRLEIAIEAENNFLAVEAERESNKSLEQGLRGESSKKEKEAVRKGTASKLELPEQGGKAGASRSSAAAADAREDSTPVRNPHKALLMPLALMLQDVLTKNQLKEDFEREMKKTANIDMPEVKLMVAQYSSQFERSSEIGSILMRKRQPSTMSDRIVFDEDEGEALWIYNMLLQKETIDDLSDQAINSKRRSAT